MKIGILTITNGENYGNRLQNYATQKVLESIGYEVETIKNVTGHSIKNDNSIKGRIKYFVGYIYEKIGVINIKKMNEISRYVSFYKFTNTYINQSKDIVSNSYVPVNISDRYDYFVCGSDQVWNPKFDFNSEVNFATFAKKEQRIAYSASFGISEIPERFVPQYKEWINGMCYLSIREQAGADIIKKLTNRDAVVLVDPTLMLSKQEWLSIAKRPIWKSEKKYILTYFLGNKIEEWEGKINKIANEKGFEIINLLDITNKNIYSSDPSEFIALINECELMCTDSFHGVVFSLIMKSPFIVFERRDGNTSMNSRLDTLLSLFKMESRLEKNIANDNEIFHIDFNNVDSILEVERSKAFIYLKNALKFKNNKQAQSL